MDTLIEIIVLLFAHTRISAHVQRHPEIAAHVREVSARHQVPEALLLAVGLHESGLGSDGHTRFVWGVMPPAMRACARAGNTCTGDVLHDQIEVSARVLLTGYRQCHSWDGALRRYYSGMCFATRPRITFREARNRQKVRRFYVRQRLFVRTVAYSTRVLGSARTFERKIREVAGGLLGYHLLATNPLLPPP
jgi:hypothetical protein